MRADVRQNKKQKEERRRILSKRMSQEEGREMGMGHNLSETGIGA